jgi:preprotein translocase subunit SecY
MASAAEQLAANINFSSFAKAEELQKRIWFTLGALVIYRLGCYIPLPGIDPAALAQAMEQQRGGLMDLFNMFSGGALSRMAIFALNVMPYISASIIVQLLSSTVPSLEALKKEGEAGRKQLNQYTRYLTIVLAALQSYGIAVGLQSSGAVVTNPGPVFLASTVITLTGGTIFLLWLGEQITARGIGNGTSLIIFVGIVASLWAGIFHTLDSVMTGALAWWAGLALFALIGVIIVVIVFFERAQRRLLVQYPKRQQGNRVFGGESSHLPLKLNTAGVIPPIFASSLLLMPMTIANFNAQGAPWWLTDTVALLGHGKPLYMILYGALIIFFCFFYTAIVFNPKETAENLKKYNGFLPGIRPGQKTAEYIDYVLTRLTVVGAIYITAVCLVPEFIVAQYGANLLAMGGTSILILVTVTMDTVAQVHSHLLAHQYEGLIKKAKFRGAKR